jgi:hypothetical protein
MERFNFASSMTKTILQNIHKDLGEVTKADDHVIIGQVDLTNSVLQIRYLNDKQQGADLKRYILSQRETSISDVKKAVSAILRGYNVATNVTYVGYHKA